MHSASNLNFDNFSSINRYFRLLPLSNEYSVHQWSEIQSQVESYQRLKKWYLMLPCLTINIIRWESRVKWSNPRNRVAPSPTHRCGSYWKGSLWVTLDLGCQLYFFYLYVLGDLPHPPDFLRSFHIKKKREFLHKIYTILIDEILLSTSVLFIYNKIWYKFGYWF